MKTKDPAAAISIMSKTVREINRKIEANLKNLGVDGVVPSHGEILFNLFRYKRLTMKELASKIDRDKSTLTTLVNKLREKGYILKEQDERDKRTYHISLTAKGEKLEPEFHKISQTLLEQFYKNFSEEEKHQFMALLTKISMN